MCYTLESLFFPCSYLDAICTMRNRGLVSFKNSRKITYKKKIKRRRLAWCHQKSAMFSQENGFWITLHIPCTKKMNASFSQSGWHAQETVGQTQSTRNGDGNLETALYQGPFHLLENKLSYTFFLFFSQMTLLCSRFDAKPLLEKLRGKKLMFIGDSIHYNQWQSMVCMVQSIIPSSKKTLNHTAQMSIFITEVLNAQKKKNVITQEAKSNQNLISPF